MGEHNPAVAPLGDTAQRDVLVSSKPQRNAPCRRQRINLKFPSSLTKISFCPQGPTRFCRPRFCLRGDLVDQLTGAKLQVVRHCQHRECGSGLWNAARIAHDRAELREECVEAVDWRTVLESF